MRGLRRRRAGRRCAATDLICFFFLFLIRNNTHVQRQTRGAELLVRQSFVCPKELLNIPLVTVIFMWMVRSYLVGLIVRCKLVFILMCTRVGVHLGKIMFALLIVV